MYKNDKLPDGHIIMLGKGNEEQALKALHTYPGGFQIGGDINPENALNFIEKGATHIIVSSCIFENENLDFKKLEKLVEDIGQKKLVIDLSCSIKNGKYFAVINKWQKFSNFELSKENLILLSDYCDEFLIHAVDVEGQRKGIEKNLVCRLGEYISNHNIKKITYAGGINSFDDIKFIYEHGKRKLDFCVGSGLDIFGGQYFL